MSRAPNDQEDRLLRAMRQADVISADQYRTVLTLLEATELCPRCGGDGQLEETHPDLSQRCPRCNGTGEEYILR